MGWVIGLVVALGLVMVARWSGHPAAALAFPIVVLLVAVGLLRHLAFPLLRRAQEEQEARMAEAAHRHSPVEVRVVPLGGAGYEVLVNGERLWVEPFLGRALDRATAVSRRLRERRFAVSPVSGPWRSTPLLHGSHQHGHEGHDGGQQERPGDTNRGR